MTIIVMTREAMRKLTEGQKEAILRLTNDEGTGTVEKLEITSSNPFDLPADYIAFRLDYSAVRTDNRRSIYGGIAGNGDVST